MEVCEVLGTHNLPFTIWRDLIVGHPFAILAWKVSDFARPSPEYARVDQLVFVCSENEKARLIEVPHLVDGELERCHLASP